MSPDTVYLTTPLYYVNAAPHIGHSYTTIAADCLKRFHQLAGRKVFLLTGTDEHGQKIAQAAAKAGKEPQAFTDEVSRRFHALWQRLNIQHDDYIRTTEPRHVKAVQEILLRLKEGGKLRREFYEGWYCTPDETFWTEAELARGPNKEPLCPQCQRPVELVREEGWHLPLEEYRGWLRKHLADNPGWILPASRFNELKSLLEQRLPETLCITRPKSRVSWGIPVPFAPELVVYVWVDALFNYITVPGYPSDEKRFRQFWPADTHLIGKDILRHHALYWPILLQALDLPLPKRIVAHGHWKMGEQKMSKSLGNIIDPYVVMDGLLKGQPFAADIYRYFLLREVPFGQDGSFSEDALLARFNADLANDLGNLVNRSCSMIERYCGGVIPPAADAGSCGDLGKAASALADSVAHAMDELQFSVALDAIMRLVTQANQFIEVSAPWKQAKQPEGLAVVARDLAVLAETLRIVAIAIEPFMPSVAQSIWQQLGFGADAPRKLSDARCWPAIAAGQKLGLRAILFPKPDAKAGG